MFLSVSVHIQWPQCTHLIGWRSHCQHRLHVIVLLHIVIFLIPNSTAHVETVTECIDVDVVLNIMSFQLSPSLRNRFVEIWCPCASERESLKKIIDHNLKPELHESGTFYYPLMQALSVAIFSTVYLYNCYGSIDTLRTHSDLPLPCCCCCCCCCILVYAYIKSSFILLGNWSNLMLNIVEWLQSSTLLGRCVEILTGIIE